MDWEDGTWYEGEFVNGRFEGYNSFIEKYFISLISGDILSVLAVKRIVSRFDPSCLLNHRLIAG